MRYLKLSLGFPLVGTICCVYCYENGYALHRESLENISPERLSCGIPPESASVTGQGTPGGEVQRRRQVRKVTVGETEEEKPRILEGDLQSLRSSVRRRISMQEATKANARNPSFLKHPTIALTLEYVNWLTHRHIQECHVYGKLLSDISLTEDKLVLN